MKPRSRSGATLPGDPDNRLIAASSRRAGRRRSVASRRVRRDWRRCRSLTRLPRYPDFAGLANDLEAAWNAPGVSVRATTAPSRPRHQHHRRRRRDGARSRPDDPLARRPALAIAGPQAEIRRAWLPHPRRGPRRDAEHGHAMVGRRHRRVVEPDGNAHRSGKDLDRAPCQLAAAGTRHPCLPFRGEERRMADDDRSRRATRRHQPPDPPPHQGPCPRRRAGRSGGPFTESAPPTFRTSGSSPRSGEQVARVASIWKTNSQCLQTLEEEGHNEPAASRSTPTPSSGRCGRSRRGEQTCRAAWRSCR